MASVAREDLMEWRGFAGDWLTELRLASWKEMGAMSFIPIYRHYSMQCPNYGFLVLGQMRRCKHGVTANPVNGTWDGSR